MINKNYQQIDITYPNVQMVCENPPLYIIDDFLNRTQCQALIQCSSDHMILAPVVGKGNGEVSNARTSSTCFLFREDCPSIVNNVSKLLMNKPISHIELPQVGRYNANQEYQNHYDAFDTSTEDGKRFASNGGQRICTVLIYLNSVLDGGQTSFPNANMTFQPKEGEFESLA